MFSSDIPSSPHQNVLDGIEISLKKGDRAGACRLAMQSGMWSHAILLSLIDSNLQKEVVSAFGSSNMVSGQDFGVTDLSKNSCLRVFYHILSASGPSSCLLF